MLGNKDVAATIAVKDLSVARKFYEGVLGLKPSDTDEPTTATYKSGNSSVLVYESQFAGTNKATCATWSGGKDVEETVKALKAKGVTFEHYDMPGLTLQGDVHVADGMKVAWCKDPDGNILAIVSQ